MKLFNFSRGGTKSFLVGAAAIALLVFLAYLPALSAGFIWDDDAWVYNNPYVKGERSILKVWYTAEVPGQNYPLTYTFFWVQCRLWGLNPLGYHLSNIVLHILDAVLLWAVLRKLHAPAAWFVAAVFALHPLMVESVAWVTEAKNVLSAFFLFSALLLFLRFELDGKRSSYALSIMLYMLALLSKTSICTFPLILIILRWYREGEVRFKYIRKLLPLFTLSLLAGAFTWYYETGHVGVRGMEWAMPFTARIIIAGKAFWFYLGKLLLPVKLTFIYPRWYPSPERAGEWVFPVTALAFLVFLWLARRRLGRGPFACLASYTVLALPALGFIGFYAQIYSFVADHYVYLAVIGPIAIVSAGASRLISNAWIKNILGCAVLVSLGILTFNQSGIYLDPETLWLDTIKKNPRAWMAHNNLGVLYARQGRLNKAIDRYSEALRINPDHAGALNKLGEALALQGRFDEAVARYSEALRISPGYAEAHYNLGKALARKGAFDEAILHYSRAIRFKPGHAAAHYNLGNALAAQGAFDAAVAQYAEALRIKPDHEKAHVNLGNACQKLGRYPYAVRAYKRAILINTDNVSAHFNLGIAYLHLGDGDSALYEYGVLKDLDGDMAAKLLDSMQE
ncbi:MAG: tetratricopeptide repeat protein [Candidatus Tritonobacter lacicola]|nr:tetratricopeptide repeat protein [Candidatus Tritonobacter lacicola]